MWRRIAAIAVKEARQIRRDRRTLGLLIFLPALMLMLYGYALTFDVRHIRVAVLDQDHSAASRQFAAGLFHSEYFELAGLLERPEEADAWLDAGRARAVLAIPPGYGERLAVGRPAPVQALIDGGNANSASITLGYIEGRARELNMTLRSELAQRRGLGNLSLPIQVEARVWYNPDLESSRFLVPGLIGFLLMVIGAVSTSLSVVREKERGTLEQIVVSATRPGEFVVGKVAPYLAIMLLTEALIVLAAMLLFDMPLRGSVGWLLVASVVYLLGGLGFGLLVSTVAETQQVAFQIAVLATMLPSMLLSDLIFPIASMPAPLQKVTWVVPARHFISILRSLILKGSGVESWALSLAILVAFAAVVLTVASLRLARRLRSG